MRLLKSSHLLVPFLFALGCSDSNEPTDSDASSKSDSSTGGSGGSGGSDGSADTGGSGGSANAGGSGGSADAGGSGGSSTTTGGTAGSSTTGSNDSTTGVSPIPGDPGCGLDSAAFCDTFDEQSTKRGRAGDLNPSVWSASRGKPQTPTGNGSALPVGPATLPPCRADLPDQVLPDDDSLICDADQQIQSRHLLVAVGSQNYGQNSYRIRQPFDFADRTGKIVFDAEGFMPRLVGWPSIAVTEDPTPIPGYSLGPETVVNDEGSVAPRSGFLVVFHNCQDNRIGVRVIDVMQDYLETPFTSEDCPIEGEQGYLNHFEVTVSQSRIEVYGTTYSEDGVTFGEAQLLHAADVDLPFSRGYVHITVHNHASLKYSADGLGKLYDAWFGRWDNVGFDGPIVENWREYEAPDSLVPGMDGHSLPGPVMNVGYRVADESTGPSDVIEFQDVDLKDAVSARLTFGSWYRADENAADFMLKYRFNGGEWRERPLTDGELALLESYKSQNALSQVIDVPLEDLVEGTNTLEFVTVNVPQDYPPAVSSLDLILTTN